MHAISEEINSYLTHQDFQLFKRRLLDASYETNSGALMDETILWSQSAPENITDTNDKWLIDGKSILDKIGKSLQSLPTKENVQLVSAENVSKNYTKGNFSLKAFNIKIVSGEIIGIVGENGNGKTTLLRCLAGQLERSSGVLSYFGIDKENELFDIKHRVAFIPQRIPRWYGLLKDNLHFSAAISGIHGKENDRMVQFMLERMNLTKYAQLTWDRISSGYRTRFEIARILLQKPNLLILDEPLANLDIHAQQTLLSDLRFLVKSPALNLGVILSSQQLHEVEKVADRVLLIKNGNCYSNQDLMQSANDNETVLEIETTDSRDTLVAALPDDITVAFNGNFYTLKGDFSVNTVLQKLVASNIEILYFRNITNSTKRYF
ncbi:MAG: ABC transporter ATP-binding protein [Chitinophagales bacterium]